MRNRLSWALMLAGPLCAVALFVSAAVADPLIQPQSRADTLALAKAVSEAKSLELNERSVRAAEAQVVAARYQIFLALAGTVALIYSLKLGRDSSRAAIASAEVAERALRESSRPWVGVGQITVNPDVATSPWVIVELKNYGGSPATNVRFRGTSALGPGAEVTEPPDSTPWAVSGTIFPGASVRLTPFKFGLDRQQATALASGQVTAVFSGIVTYSDGSGTEHATTYRRFYRPDVQKFAFHRDGDEAT